MQKKILIPIALPGTGKSTLYRKLSKQYPQLTIISPDLIRFRILDFEHTRKDYDPTIEPQVWKEAYDTIETVMKKKVPIYFDATNLKQNRRQELHRFAQKWHYKTMCLYFNISLEESLRRNRQRERIVPEDVIRTMQSIREKPTKAECDSIYQVNDKMQIKKITWKQAASFK